MQITRNSNSRVCYLCNKPAGLCVKSSFFFIPGNLTHRLEQYTSMGQEKRYIVIESSRGFWSLTRYIIRMENPLVVGSSRRSFPGKIAARPPASYLLWPRAQGSRSEIIRCYRTACHSATVSRVPFAASSAPQIAVPETPPANQSRIMVIHRYSIVVFLAKTRRLGDDPTFLPALPAFVTKPLNIWIMVRAPMKRFMIEHRLEVSSMEQENLCNSGNENRE